MIRLDLFKKGLEWLKHYAAIIAIFQAIIFTVSFVAFRVTEKDIFMFGADAVAYDVLHQWHANTTFYGYRSMDECREYPDYYYDIPCADTGLNTDLQMITEAFESYEVTYEEGTIGMVMIALYPLEPPPHIEDELMSRIPD